MIADRFPDVKKYHIAISSALTQVNAVMAFARLFQAAQAVIYDVDRPGRAFRCFGATETKKAQRDGDQKVDARPNEGPWD